MDTWEKQYLEEAFWPPVVKRHMDLLCQLSAMGISESSHQALEWFTEHMKVRKFLADLNDRKSPSDEVWKEVTDCYPGMSNIRHDEASLVADGGVWTLEMDEDLVNLIDERLGLEAAVEDHQLTGSPDDLIPHRQLASVPEPAMYSRFAYLASMSESVFNQLACQLDFDLQCSTATQHIRNCKSLMLFSMKRMFLDGILNMDVSSDVDQPQIELNRAVSMRLRGSVAPTLAWSRTCFGQAYAQLSTVIYSPFYPTKLFFFLTSVCYLFQKSVDIFATNVGLYRVKFTGEGATDLGGPYRESISTIVDELHSPLLPLFIPTPNNRS